MDEVEVGSHSLIVNKHKEEVKVVNSPSMPRAVSRRHPREVKRENASQRKENWPRRVAMETDILHLQ